MGSHSYVMPDPQQFLERYHQWSLEMAETYRDLLPQEDYEYGFDPYWVSAYPYRVDLSKSEMQEVTVTIRNFRDVTQQHRVELCLPDGVSASPPVLAGEVPAHARKSLQVTLRREEAGNRKANDVKIQIVPFDMTLDGQRYGQLFDMILRVPE